MAKQGYETPNDGYQEPLPGIFETPEEQAPIAERSEPAAPITVEIKDDKPLNPAHLTPDQIEKLTSHDDQFTPMQNARRAGIKYIPSSPPDSARQPEKAHTTYGDRRHLSPTGKSIADDDSKVAEIYQRREEEHQLREARTEEERILGAEQAQAIFDKLNNPKPEDS